MLPPYLQMDTDAGERRRLGVELEFSGMPLAEVATTVLQTMRGEVVEQTEAEQLIAVPELGGFKVEIDWDFLKRKAQEATDAEGIDWVRPLSQAASAVVPIEVVTPPIALDKLSRLDDLIQALRTQGASGTNESLIAAYGTHLNPEAPALDAATLLRFMQAFALLQWWLFDANSVDPTRRLTPYIDPWPEDYLVEVVMLREPTIEALIDQYLDFNPTRNRALDMLPLFAHLDEARVQSAVDDPRVKPRPAFHYRLPNCNIHDPEWGLTTVWQPWCVVERLAGDTHALSELGEEFIDAQRPILGASKNDWIHRIHQWIDDLELA